jgi:hypothetical protein
VDRRGQAAQLEISELLISSFLWIAGGEDAFVLDHKDYGAMRRARAMHHSLGNDETLSRIKLHRAVFKIDEQLTLDDVEKLVVSIVLVPVILPLHDAKADNGLVYLAERLVVPLEFTGIRKSLGVDDFKRAV